MPNPTVLGLITARGGSRGIPRKNIRPLAGRPLIAYTIDAAKKSALLTRTIVSTDDEEIATVARGLGGDVPFVRPAELARDDSGSIEVAVHALDELARKGEEFDYVMLLQPTSPLRLANDIDACIRIAADTGADSVMSMVQLADFAPQKLKRIEGDRILPLLKDEGPRSAHRDAEKVYKRNTAIYLTKASVLRAGDLFGSVSRPYVMPPERSLDINEPFDWEIAEFLLSKRP